MKTNTIKFNKSGKLTILQVSDPQDLRYVRRSMVRMLDNAYDTVKPDIVLFTGDNILGNHLLDARIGNRKVASGKAATLESMREAIKHITMPLEKRGIPFAMIYGNHDDMNEVSKEEQADIFREYSMCLPMNTDDASLDCDTYRIPIMSSDGEKHLFDLWMLDSAWCDKEQDKCFTEVKPSAVEWFRRTSEELKKENGGKPVPSLMFLHIPLPVTMELVEKSDVPTDGAIGNEKEGWFRLKPDMAKGVIGEPPSILNDDAGLFDAVLECGGVKAIVTGHDHVNDFEGRYKGVDFVQTAAASFRCYGNDRRGVRVFVLDEADPENYSTYSLTYPELCGNGIESKLAYIWDADDKIPEKIKLISAGALGLTSVIAAAVLKKKRK